MSERSCRKIVMSGTPCYSVPGPRLPCYSESCLDYVLYRVMSVVPCPHELCQRFRAETSYVSHVNVWQASNVNSIGGKGDGNKIL